MVEFRAFRAMRFRSVRDQPPVDAPPSWRARATDRAAEREVEVNVVHLLDPLGRPEDRSKYVRFAGSAALMAQWRRQGVLEVDDVPRHPVAGPFRAGLVPLDRTELLILTPIPPAEREERRRLLEATRAHFEFPVGLAEFDEDGTPVGPILVIEGGAVVEAAKEHRRARGARADGKAEEWVPIWLGDLRTESVRPHPIQLECPTNALPTEPFDLLAALAGNELGPWTPAQSPESTQDLGDSGHDCTREGRGYIRFPALNGEQAMRAFAMGLPIPWRVENVTAPMRAGAVMCAWADWRPAEAVS
jgi:hypothetical protein